MKVDQKTKRTEPDYIVLYRCGCVGAPVILDKIKLACPGHGVPLDRVFKEVYWAKLGNIRQGKLRVKDGKNIN